VCVALGHGFSLAVTDAGAVYSFGHSQHGALGHGSLESEVLPRRITALAETGLRFVGVAAGFGHALALAEEGQVYGWGESCVNGHGQQSTLPWVAGTPQRVAALACQRVKLVHAQGYSSCAVTEKCELYTWGFGIPSSFHLGHGVGSAQQTPKRVEVLSRVKVATAAVSRHHTLAADTDGAVWAFGEPAALRINSADAPLGDRVGQPTLIPNLLWRMLTFQ